MSRPIVLACAALLAGCQGLHQSGARGNENSPYFELPLGSRLALERKLTIPARDDRIFFQDGRTMALEYVDRYRAYCELRLYASGSAAQTVHPDTFVLRKIYQTRKWQLARAGFVRVGHMDQGGGGDFEVVATVMELRSARQPDVRTLLCAEWGAPQDMSFVTVRMIREQLAGFFTITLPD